MKYLDVLKKEIESYLTNLTVFQSEKFNGIGDILKNAVQMVKKEYAKKASDIRTKIEENEIIEGTLGTVQQLIEELDETISLKKKAFIVNRDSSIKKEIQQLRERKKKLYLSVDAYLEEYDLESLKKAVKKLKSERSKLTKSLNVELKNEFNARNLAEYVGVYAPLLRDYLDVTGQIAISATHNGYFRYPELHRLIYLITLKEYTWFDYLPSMKNYYSIIADEAVKNLNAKIIINHEKIKSQNSSLMNKALVMHALKNCKAEFGRGEDPTMVFSDSDNSIPILNRDFANYILQRIDENDDLSLPDFVESILNEYGGIPAVISSEFLELQRICNLPAERILIEEQRYYKEKEMQEMREREEREREEQERLEQEEQERLEEEEWKYERRERERERAYERQREIDRHNAEIEREREERRRRDEEKRDAWRANREKLNREREERREKNHQYDLAMRQCRVCKNFSKCRNHGAYGCGAFIPR